jgi:pimeloyl-ACP methyl ester carboxylesterase
LNRGIVSKLRTPALLVGLVAGLSVTTGTAGAAEPGRHTYTGTLNGADYRVETPAHWNGTLIMFSHGYIPAGVPFPPGIPLANRAETEQWLLDHGYALAGSDFQGRTGLVVQEALTDQTTLLDWFDTTIGKPRHTIASGFSMGGGIATRLAERNPGRFDGVLAISGSQDMQATMNRGLDVTFAVRTLLTDDQRLELVKAADPGHSVQVLQQAVQQALTTPTGRAKLALAGAIGGLPGWANAHQPQPTDLVERIRQQEWWIESAYIATLGPQGRKDIERRAGGNPSFNVGVDYAQELARSGERDLVEQAYQAAGTDVRDDLRRLAEAPRIAPDPKALLWMYQFAVSAGTTPTPVVTLHGVAEGLVGSDARWYGEQVRRFGNPDQLRQLYVDRGDHGPFSAADEILALQTLLNRVETGTWPDVSPKTLNAQAATFTPQQQTVFDIFTVSDQVQPPAFTDKRPPRALRPSL